MSKKIEQDEFHHRGRMVAGTALGMLLLLGCGGWAAVAQINGAIVAQGQIKVDQNLKSIQHRDGGIVSEIAVREGDFVKAGQIMIRLDDVQTQQELSIVRSQLSELVARKARLKSERDGLSEIVVGQGTGIEELRKFGEIRLFDGNRTNRESQKEQLRFEIEQLGEEIKGLQAQQSAKRDEVVLVEIEHKKMKRLSDKKLIENSRVHVTERELARLKGELGETDAGIARARARMSGIKLQIISVDENAKTEAQRELSTVDTKISEFNDRRVAIEDRLSRTDIRAPLSGIVNELAVHTVGGVITPAETLATLVPEKARLKIEARLSPVDIDQVYVGQVAKLRFSAFNQRTTPELSGQIGYVSAATTRDAATNDTYYVADVIVSADELKKLGKNELMPGMPVEVFVATEQRTALSFLSKPLVDQFSRAFREQ